MLADWSEKISWTRMPLSGPSHQKEQSQLSSCSARVIDEAVNLTRAASAPPPLLGPSSDLSRLVPAHPARAGLTPAKLSDLLVKLKEREKEAADTSGDNAAWGSAANDGFPAAVGLNASAGPVPGVLNSLTNGPHEGLTNGLSAGPNGLTNGLSGLVDGLANGAHAGLIGAPMSNSLSNSLCTSLTTSLNGSPSTSFKGSVSSEGPALDLKSFPALQLANEPGFGRMRLPPPHFQQIMRHLDVHAAGTRTCGGCCFSSMPLAGMEHAQCKFAAHDACAPTPLTPNDFSYRLPPQFEEYARMQA
eukprot:5170117-Pleurochrysis_carterae.AAC.1